MPKRTAAMLLRHVSDRLALRNSRRCPATCEMPTIEQAVACTAYVAWHSCGGSLHGQRHDWTRRRPPASYGCRLPQRAAFHALGAECAKGMKSCGYYGHRTPKGQVPHVEEKLAA